MRSAAQATNRLIYFFSSIAALSAAEAAAAAALSALVTLAGFSAFSALSTTTEAMALRLNGEIRALPGQDEVRG